MWGGTQDFLWDLALAQELEGSMYSPAIGRDSTRCINV